jgi:hypothetical protein
MIEIFEGRLGAGKSYHAVVRILAHLAQGGHVFTNISLNIETVLNYLKEDKGLECSAEQLHSIDIKDVSTFDRVLQRGNDQLNVLCVIDEAHLFLNSRDWATADRGLLSFLTQSRKYNVDVIFISQNALNCDKQIMRLVHNYVRHRDMKDFGIPYLGLKWPFNQILVIVVDYDLKTIKKRFLIDKNSKIFNCYQTKQLLDNRNEMSVAQMVQPRKIKKDKSMAKVLTLVTLLTLLIFTVMFLGMHHLDEKVVRPKTPHLSKDESQKESPEKRSEFIEIKNAPVTLIQEQLTKVYGERIKVAAMGNSILISGNADDVREVIGIISGMDKPVRKYRVRAMFVRCQLNGGEEFGVDWLKALANASTDVPAIAVTAGVGSFKGIFDGVSALVKANKTKGRVEASQQMELLAIEGQPCSIQFGSLNPIAESVTNLTGTTQTVQTIDVKTGIGITIVRYGSQLAVSIKQNEQSITGSTTISGNSVPIVGYQSADTTMVASSGEELVIGGLSGVSSSQSYSGLPLLSEVPIIKNLTGDQINSNQRFCSYVVLSVTAVADLRSSSNL